MARVLCLVLWVMLCLTGCHASFEYTVKAHGKPVVEHSLRVNPFVAKGKTDIDVTAMCDACKLAYPTAQGTPLDPRCAGRCGFGFYGPMGGMPVTPGEAAARRMGIGGATSLSPAPSASASAAAPVSSATLRPLFNKVAADSARICGLSARVRQLEQDAGVPAPADPRCQSDAGTND